MAESTHDRLKRKLSQGAAGALPGGARAALEDKLGTRTAAAQEQAAKYAPTDVYLDIDGTGSMTYVFTAVLDGMRDIGRELFSAPDRGDIRMAAWAVYDHEFREVYRRHDLTSHLDVLASQIASIADLDINPRVRPGGDHAEAYECVWIGLSRELAQPAALQQPSRKKVVVFMGDMFPHGLAADANYILPLHFHIG